MKQLMIIKRSINNLTQIQITTINKNSINICNILIETLSESNIHQIQQYSQIHSIMFDDICKRILSPPKFKYSMYDLGSNFTKFGKRTDFTVFNYKNHKMNCSYFQPFQVLYDRTCVIYLHSMNGSRLQSIFFVIILLGLMYVDNILKEGVAFCCFDFSGCGNSDGERITFGANQKYDIEAVINKLKQTFFLNRFILWGRSMGSVSAIKYSQLIYDKSKVNPSQQKQQIIGLILDSPFKSFSKLIVQIGSTQSDVPKFLVQAGYMMIKNTLQSQGQFKISQLDLISQNAVSSNGQKSPLQKIKFLTIPILFLASKDDKTVPCQHSIDMYDSYDCLHKQIKFFKGLHNENRQDDYIGEVLNFVRHTLKLQKFTMHASSVSLEKSLSPRNPVSSQSIQQLRQKNYAFNPVKENEKQSSLSSKRTSILKLIQSQQRQAQSTGENKTYFESQAIQSTCFCTMFQNEYIPQKTARQKIKNSPSNLKQYNFQRKSQKTHDDEFIEKNGENYIKTKKSLTQNSHHMNLKIGNSKLLIKNSNSPQERQKIDSRSPKNIRQKMPLSGQSFNQQIKKNNQSPEQKTQRGLHYVYKPYKVVSQKQLKLMLKQNEHSFPKIKQAFSFKQIQS